MTDLSRRRARLDPCLDRESAGVLALINSLGTTSKMWDDLAAELRSAFDVVRFDQRGYDAEAAAEDHFGLDDLVTDVIAVLDSFGVDRAHLAGTSLGGMVAARAAASYPDRVNSLTIICSAPVLPRADWLDRAAIVRRSGLDEIRDTVLQRWFTPEFAAQSPGIVERYANMLVGNDPEQYARSCEILAAADVRGDLAHIIAPTLVIGGSADIATPPADQDKYASGVKGARLKILEGIAHMAPAAAPTAIADAIIAHARTGFERGGPH